MYDKTEFNMTMKNIDHARLLDSIAVHISSNLDEEKSEGLTSETSPRRFSNRALRFVHVCDYFSLVSDGFLRIARTPSAYVATGGLANACDALARIP